jgi:methylated-DNA-[protein]-cysteine S-methyltransferase
MKKLYTHKFNSGIGQIYVGSTEKGLAVISFGRNGRQYFDNLVKELYGDYQIISGGGENRRAEKQLGQYLDGKLKKFSLKLDIDGTAFQKKALRKIASIPYGKTTTYGVIAAAIGHKGAARAVGTVNAKNRLPIVIPCHRVVATNGLGGYAGGLKLKRYFLDLEKAKY